MNRRNFIALAVAAALAPKALVDDGIALRSISHPIPFDPLPLSEPSLHAILTKLHDEMYAQMGVNWMPFIKPTQLMVGPGLGHQVSVMLREIPDEEFYLTPDSLEEIEIFVDDPANRLPLIKPTGNWV